MNFSIGVVLTILGRIKMKIEVVVSEHHDEIEEEIYSLYQKLLQKYPDLELHISLDTKTLAELTNKEETK